MIIPNTLINPDTLDTSNLVQALRSIGDVDHADRVEACGSTTPGIPYPQRCKSRWCRNCQRTKGKILSRDLLPQMDLEERHYFATLVYRDLADINPEHVQGLKKTLSSLNGKTALRNIEGAYGVCEVSYDASKELPYHLHVHLLMEGQLKQKGCRSLDVLQDAWVRSGGNPDVHHRYLPIMGEKPDQCRKELKNCFRYMSKGLRPGIPAQAQEKILRAFGPRLSSFRWGFFRRTN